LVFLGFPLHPAGRPSQERAAHLAAVDVPMLFVQGTRDALADWGLLDHVIQGLGARATLHRIGQGDHSLHVPVRSGQTDMQVLDAALDAVAAFIATATPAESRRHTGRS
jgi:predicted alpha/beta-hydrolase family hydrolase